MKEHIKRYCERNWYMVVLKPQSKLPLSAETTYKHATSDYYKLMEYFDGNSRLNIGIQPAMSGMLVLDVDPKNGGLASLEELENLHGKLLTLSVTTGSGGLHYYFRQPPAGLKNKLGVMPGIDIISDVNHVVAPPSVHASGGLYRWNDETAPVLPCPEWLLKMMSPPRTPPTLTTPATLTGTRGRLSQLTLDFLKNGAEPGTWNHRLFKAAKDYQEQLLSMEEFITDATKITGHLDSKDMSTIESAFRNEPKYEPRANNNVSVREIVLKCHLITNLSDTSERIFVNLKTGRSYPKISSGVINGVLSRDERADYLKQRSVLAYIEYNPHLSSILQVEPETGIHIYNTYIPPSWREGAFYHKQELEKVTQIPEIYDEFFTHLTAGHTESKDYLIDWVANSLQSRNYTILTAIGNQGIGKGVFGTILEALHGKSNFDSVNDNVFKERFNGKLQNKTLIYVDEVALNDKQSHDRIKAVVNSSLEIERKGKDAITVRNHASFYISSNNLDAIDVSADDRRYSMIQLTDEKLASTKWIPLIDTELYAPKNIERLALYLYQLKIERNMLVPFRSPRFEEVRGATLKPWQEFLIDELLPAYRGKEIALSFIQDEIKANCGLFTAPSRRTIEGLQRKYTDVFRVKQKKSERGKRYVEVFK